MLTLWPAYGAFQEAERGSIAVGKAADLSVFDTDFMTDKPSNILQAQVLLTLVAGNVTYQKNSLE